MKKIFLTLILCVYVVFCFSQIVTRKEAEIAAKNFFYQEFDISEIKDVFEKKYNNHYSYFLINMVDSGWVVVAANKNISPILAYSNEGHAIIQKLPDVFWDWMQQYEELTDLAYKGVWHSKENNQLWDKLLSNKKEGQLKTFSDASYLLYTKWGQGATHDGNCPGYNSFIEETSSLCNDNYCYKCSAGCVAIAVAQIMNYWGYATSDYTDFNWWNIPNKLYSNSPYINDISYLIKRAGDEANVIYCSQGCSSEATIDNECDAFINFGYKNTFQVCCRQTSSESGWTATLLSETQNGRPVPYMYIGGSDAHAFICDGVNPDNNALHFNFGWNGDGDGWFSYKNIFMDSVILFHNTNAHYYIKGLQPNITDTLLWVNKKISENSNKTYQTKVRIEASNDTIEPNASCRLITGKDIVLKPGFKAKGGSTLLCKIYKKVNLRSTKLDFIEEPFDDNILTIDYSETNKISIYPNPTSDLLHINAGQLLPNKNLTAKIFTNNGTLVYNNIFPITNEITVDVSSLKKGQYILQLNSNDVIFEYKFIKN